MKNKILLTTKKKYPGTSIFFQLSGEKIMYETLKERSPIKMFSLVPSGLPYRRLSCEGVLMVTADVKKSKNFTSLMTQI